MYHESTYHDFLPCSVNIFRLEIGARFFLYHESVPSQNSLIHTLHFPLTTVSSYHYIPVTSYLPSSSRKYPCLRCLFRSPPFSSTYTAPSPTTKINYGVDTRGKKKKRTSKKNVDGRCTSSHENKTFRSRSVVK